MVAFNSPVQPKFPLGVVLATAGAVLALDRANQLSLLFLKRHSSGDWGEVCESDKKLNDEAVENGGRLLSAYTTRRGDRIWIITEADRSATTVLLPEEY
jgi:hypothetical protein